MLTEYLAAAMELAQFEVIDDPEPYYGTVTGITCVWATGKTLEECRYNLTAAFEDWVFFSVARGHTLPVLNGLSIDLPQRVGAL